MTSQLLTTALDTHKVSKLSAPNLLIRIESVAILAASVALYAHLAFGWGAFALLFLVPDLAMVGYLLNPVIGSMLYNLLHTYSLPVGLAAVGILFALPFAQQLALIWLAHIALDRMIGYGLKYADAFKHTHLSNI